MKAQGLPEVVPRSAQRIEGIRSIPVRPAGIRLSAFQPRASDCSGSELHTHPGIDGDRVVGRARSSTDRVAQQAGTGPGLRIRWSGVRIPPGAPLLRRTTRCCGQAREAPPDLVLDPRSTAGRRRRSRWHEHLTPAGSGHLIRPGLPDGHKTLTRVWGEHLIRARRAWAVRGELLRRIRRSPRVRCSPAGRPRREIRQPDGLLPFDHHIWWFRAG